MTVRTISAFVRHEWVLVLSAATCLVFFFSRGALLEELSSPPYLAFIFLWLFTVLLGSALSVVRHADHLALRLGEPYGGSVAAARGLAAPRAALQPSGCQRLSRRDRTAGRAELDPARFHADGAGAVSFISAGDVSGDRVGRPLLRVPCNADEPPPGLFHIR